MSLPNLLRQVRACTVCANALPHHPRPIVQIGARASILIIGQAPGSKVHASGTPWQDESGDRLRLWTGLSCSQFYDSKQVALMPMGFCYPGSGKSGDLPPRAECAPLWHDALLDKMPALKLTLLVGTYAMARYLENGRKKSMTSLVQAQAQAESGVIALPHPSWRVVMWMKKNSWFESDVLPVLRQRIAALQAN